MQPEQMRAARAALNWSLERLAEASGVHRNTISNFETRKYDGEPDKLAAVKRTLESAGVIFIEENGEAAGIRLRRFQVGDRVRFRPQTRVRFSFNIDADEVGTVVGVEPHPPATGPTYRMDVEFDHVRVPGVFRFEYELVMAAPVRSGDSTPSYIVAVDPIGPIEGSPFRTFDEALEVARGLERSGSKIRSINRGAEVLEGKALRKALGENTRSTFANFPKGV
jgi:transcriptional regulator with XRE-family HTH domain